MKPEEIILKTVACHGEWMKLTEEPRRPFKLFFAEKATSAFVQLRINAKLCEQLPKEVRRALKVPSGRKLGPEILKRYADEITKLWLKESAQQTLEEFVQKVTEECVTEGELRTYLHL